MSSAGKPLLFEKDIFPEELNIAKVFAAVTGTRTKQDVHRARVLVKKLRSRLRLLSAFLPDKNSIKTIDEELRCFNQSLSRLRDLDVAAETLYQLTQNRHGKKFLLIADELQGFFRVKIQTENAHV